MKEVELIRERDAECFQEAYVLGPFILDTYSIQKRNEQHSYIEHTSEVVPKIFLKSEGNPTVHKR